MTKAGSGFTKRCWRCHFFKREANDKIGACTRVASDHYGHVLCSTHPICKQFEVSI